MKPATAPQSFLQWGTDISEPDIETIRLLVERTGAFNEEEIAVAADLAREAYKMGEASDYQFVLAEVDGRLAGYSCYGRIPFTDARYDLYWIATDPSFQRHGTAGDVLARTESLIRERGGKRLYADTSSREVYAPARRFYLKHAFVQVAEFVDFYRDGDSRIAFMKILGEE